MKSKMLLALAGLLAVSMLVISPVSAQRFIYRANGTLDEYNLAVWPFGDAKVVVGSWRIKISEDYEVDFKARYLEENILEEIPGTLDKFRLSLTTVYSVTIDGSLCEVQGTLLWSKRGWDVNTGKPKRDSFTDDSTITIDTSGIRIDLWTFPGSWEIEGSTRSIHN